MSKKFINRRYQNEIAIIEGMREPSNNWDKVDLENNILIEYHYDTVHFTSIIDSDNIINIELKFPKEYPFKPPHIKINNNEYFSQLNIDESLIQDWNIKCPCCNSILCKNKWNPNYSIANILQEVRKNFKLKFDSDNLRKRREEIYYAKLITNRIFGTYLPISIFL